MNIRLKRVYESPHENDGRRILVDRIWPRGMSKAKAALDDWMKDIAPSNELRKWFDHRDERWDEFRRAYLAELDQHGDRLAELESLAKRETVTLLFAAKDEHRNNAVVIREWLCRRGARRQA